MDLKHTCEATAISGLIVDFTVAKWMEGAAITTSEFALKVPDLFKVSTNCLMDATVPLHFQLPPIRAFAILFELICFLLLFDLENP